MSTQRKIFKILNQVQCYKFVDIHFMSHSILDTLIFVGVKRKKSFAHILKI